MANYIFIYHKQEELNKIQEMRCRCWGFYCRGINCPTFNIIKRFVNFMQYD